MSYLDLLPQAAPASRRGYMVLLPFVGRTLFSLFFTFLGLLVVTFIIALQGIFPQRP